MSQTPDLPGGALLLLGLLSLFMFTVLIASVISWVTLLILSQKGYSVFPKTESRISQPYGLLDVVIVVILVLGVQVVGGGVLSIIRSKDVPVAGVHLDSVNLQLNSFNDQIVGSSSSGANQLLGNNNPESMPSKVESSTESNPKNGSSEKRLGDLPGIATVMALAILMCFVASGYLALRHKIPLGQIGWSTSRLKYDFVFMVGCFVLFVPLVYLVSALATIVSETKYDHPLVNSLIENPGHLFYAVFVGVIAAPFVEEFLFRGILQGFLEGVASRKVTAGSFLFGKDFEEVNDSGNAAKSVSGVANGSSFQENSANENTAEEAGLKLNPYAPADPNYEGNVNNGVGRITVGTNTNVAFWPVACSAVLFGLAHFDYGVSWLPLVFLGVLLGAMYRHTNRLWPCIFLHMAFNSLAIYVFAVRAFYPEAIIQ